ncbi:MAG: BatD family protein [Thermodesulfobacteriota bacterium]|nr:BatD family protein [Thermodesulfobacteriota bacterium]
MVRGIYKSCFWMIVLCVSLFCSGDPAGAQKAVSLEVYPKEASLSDTIKMVIKIQGKNNVPQPVIYGLEPFDVTEGGTSSRFQVINGQITKEVDYIYYITPRKKGSFSIGPAEVEIGGKRYKSQTVYLEIRESPSESGEKKDSLFLSAHLSDDRGYIGQEFIYKLKFYRTKDVSDISLILPDVQGLEFKKLGDHKEYASLLQGVRCSVIELRYAVIADKPGTYTIPPAYLKMKVIDEHTRSRRESLFDSPFFNMARARPVSIGSHPVELEIDPLPQKGMPGDFSGLVGNFSLGVSLMPTQIKKGGASTLTAVVSGKGNARLIQDLQIPEIKDIKLYEDQPTLEIETTIEGMSGKKTMKWAIVPQKAGKYKIPPLTLNYFDPDLEQYMKSTTTALTLEVLPGGKQEDTQGTEQKIDIEKSVKNEVNIQGLDILSIHEGLDGLRPNRFQQLDIWSVGFFLLLPPLVFLLVFGVKIYISKNRHQGDSIVAKKAGARFFKRMKALSSDAPALEMVKITNLYINERFRLKSKSLSSEEVYGILIENGVNKQLATEVRDIIMNIESVIYAGDEGKRSTAELKGDLILAMKKIDRVLP